MTIDAPTEFPEQRLTKELTRIIANLQRGYQADHSLVELFEVLTHFGLEIDYDLWTLNDQVTRFSEPVDGSLDNHRLSILVPMLQDIQTRLQCRALDFSERLEAYDSAQQANASYGGVAQWEHASPTPHAFRYQI